jgi:hypothetical protein
MPLSQRPSEPKCEIGSSVCIEKMREASYSYLLRTTGSEELFPSTKLPCEVAECHTNYNFSQLETQAKAPCAQSICPKACQIHVDHFAVLYWPQSVIARDICADDWFGTDTKVSSESVPATPAIISRTAIVLTRPNTGLEPDDVYFTTLTGNWNFTSPTVYVAYNTIKATQCGENIGKAFSSDVLAIQPGQLSSVVNRYINYRNGSGRALVEAFQSETAFLVSSLLEEVVYETRSFNFADLEGPVPPAAWLQGNIHRCFEQEWECKTIADSIYNPNIYLPLEIYRSLDPAWSACLPGPSGFVDPPKRFTEVPFLQTPTIAVLNPVITPTAVAIVGGLPVRPTPTATKRITLAPPSHTNHPGDALNLIDKVIHIDVPAEYPSSGQSKDENGLPDAAILPSGRLGSIIQSAASFHVTATSKTRDAIVLGSQTLVPGHHVQIDDRIVEVVPGGQGVIVDGRTIAFSDILYNPQNDVLGRTKSEGIAGDMSAGTTQSTNSDSEAQSETESEDAVDVSSRLGNVEQSEKVTTKKMKGESSTQTKGRGLLSLVLLGFGVSHISASYFNT